MGSGHNFFKSLFFFLVLSLFSCGKSQYQFQVFSFPSSIPPHEKGWKYQLVINVSTTKSGSMYRRSDKTVKIRIVDDKKQEYLMQVYNLSAVSNVTGKVQWENLEKLNIELVESGSDDVGDSYSEAIVEPRTIKSLQYDFSIDPIRGLVLIE